MFLSIEELVRNIKRGVNGLAQALNMLMVAIYPFLFQYQYIQDPPFLPKKKKMIK